MFKSCENNLDQLNLSGNFQSIKVIGQFCLQKIILNKPVCF